MTPYKEGLFAARAVIDAISAVCAGSSRQALIAEQIADLIDFPLTSNNLQSTRLRLQGFCSALLRNHGQRITWQPHVSLRCCQRARRRFRVIGDELLELIDIPLNWNNLEATVDRLAGFAQGLAEALPSSPCREALPEVPHGMVAALWECGIDGGHAHAH